MTKALASEPFGLPLSSWWAYAVRGLLAIALGVALLVFPAVTLALAASFFAAFAIVDGIVAIVSVFRLARGPGAFAGLPLLSGLFSIAAGAIAALHPALTLFVLVLLLAARAIVVGLVEIVTAVRLRRDVEGEWLLGLSGLLSVVFGALILFRPAVGLLALIATLSLYSIFIGSVLLALGYEARRLSRHGVGATARRFGKPIVPAPSV